MHKVGQAVRILVVEDDATDFFIISEHIKGIKNRDFVVEQCYRYSEALELINKGNYDLYIIDYVLGAKTGLDLLRAARASGCEDPMILLTGKGNAIIDEEAMKLGASDYLIKSEINSEILERSMRYALSRAAALKALRTSERKYKTIFERSQEAIFVADMALRFRDLNPASTTLLGESRERLLHRTLFDFIKDESAKEKIAGELIEVGEVNDLEIEIIDGNNETKCCTLSLLRDATAQDESIVQGIIHDITNLKKAEKASVQAEKLAATWRLAKTLAHEVRNPLSTIQMSIEQIEESGVSENDQVLVDIIKRNSQRINGLITELLESSYPGEMLFEVLDLRKILEDTIHLAKDRLQLNNIQVAMDFPHRPCIISANAEKLKMAFLNILVNSIEAVKVNEGMIRITLQNHKNHYTITMEDNGCGIPQENISNLFEPYFTSKKNGMGLGLATTLNIVKAHFGEIEVQSEVERGTNFIISLPQIKTAIEYHP